MIKKFLIASSFLVMALVIGSCSTGPGQGGKSSIMGKVHADNWNSTCTAIISQYYDPDEDVYIIYGDDPTYGDRIKTGPDGTFMFRYLRPGKYTIYVYSKDCTAPSGKTTVSVTVDNLGKKQDLVLDDINIKK